MVRATHGAWAAQKVNPLRDQLIAALEEEADREGSTVAYLRDPSFGPTIRSWADSEARIELLRSFLDGLSDFESGQPGDLDEDGQARPASLLLLRFEAKASRDRERLGLDPLSRGKLGQALAATAVDLAAVERAGAAALASRPAHVDAAMVDDDCGGEDSNDD